VRAYTIGHVEISAENSAESGRFYHEMFGWEITTREHDYVTFQDEGGLRGGFTDPAGNRLGLWKATRPPSQ
jgi:predicted enzyme related to lactoylglutathione lyase